MVWLSVCSEVQIVHIMIQLMTLLLKTPSSLASFKSTQVVLEKRPLTGVVVVVIIPTKAFARDYVITSVGLSVCYHDN